MVRQHTSKEYICLIGAIKVRRQCRLSKNRSFICRIKIQSNKSIREIGCSDFIPPHYDVIETFWSLHMVI